MLRGSILKIQKNYSVKFIRLKSLGTLTLEEVWNFNQKASQKLS